VDAQNYLEKGDVPAAIIQLKNAIETDPDNAMFRFALGTAYLQLGNSRSAAVELEAARQAGFDLTQLAAPLAQAYLLQGRYEDLLASLPAAGQSDALASDILVFRGYAHLGLGQLDDADRSFSSAIDLNPGSMRAHVGRAQLLLQRGMPTQAEQQIDIALELAPEAAETLALKGEMRRLAQDRDPARQYFDRAIAVDPSVLVARIGRAALGATFRRPKTICVTFYRRIRTTSPRTISKRSSSRVSRTFAPPAIALSS
jgi:tetratricopeptide (TPR) repeat protein